MMFVTRKHFFIFRRWVYARTIVSIHNSWHYLFTFIKTAVQPHKLSISIALYYSLIPNKYVIQCAYCDYIFFIWFLYLGGKHMKCRCTSSITFDSITFLQMQHVLFSIRILYLLSTLLGFMQNVSAYSPIYIISIHQFI